MQFAALHHIIMLCCLIQPTHPSLFFWEGKKVATHRPVKIELHKTEPMTFQAATRDENVSVGSVLSFGGLSDQGSFPWRKKLYARIIISVCHLMFHFWAWSKNENHLESL